MGPEVSGNRLSNSLPKPNGHVNGGVGEQSSMACREFFFTPIDFNGAEILAYHSRSGKKITFLWQNYTYYPSHV